MMPNNTVATIIFIGSFALCGFAIGSIIERTQEVYKKIDAIHACVVENKCEKISP